MKYYPNAKINLGLYITEKRNDGYHNLETVFYPIPLKDIIEVKEIDETDLPDGKDYILESDGIPVEGREEDNLVIKAYRQIKLDFDIPPIHIYMRKNIPSGAGLGGGSSDAAFMTKLLNEKFSLGMTPDEMEKRVSKLGADCAFFIRNTPRMATGIGDIFTPVELSLKNYHIVLVKPDVFVSTKEAFSQIKPQYPEVSVKEIIKRPISEWKHSLKNDFEDGIFKIHPVIGEIKSRLYNMGAIYASMSGSGSSVFGIFESEVSDVEEQFKGNFVFQGKL